MLCIKFLKLVTKNSPENIDVNTAYLFTSNLGIVINGKFIWLNPNVLITTYKIIGKETIPTITIEIIACFIVIFCFFTNKITNGIKNTGKK